MPKKTGKKECPTCKGRCSVPDSYRGYTKRCLTCDGRGWVPGNPAPGVYDFYSNGNIV